MTAENIRADRQLAGRDRASMRPRPMTAENGRRRRAARSAPPSFNEAAADDRGKPPISTIADVLAVALQ